MPHDTTQSCINCKQFFNPSEFSLIAKIQTKPQHEYSTRFRAERKGFFNNIHFRPPGASLYCSSEVTHGLGSFMLPALAGAHRRAHCRLVHGRAVQRRVSPVSAVKREFSSRWDLHSWIGACHAKRTSLCLYHPYVPKRAGDRYAAPKGSLRGPQWPSRCVCGGSPLIIVYLQAGGSPLPPAFLSAVLRLRQLYRHVLAGNGDGGAGIH